MKAKPEHSGASRAPTAALAEARLRDASVRVTGARINVLAALLDARRAVSHHEMQQALAGMDRVTLYRVLDCLIEAGLAHKIAGDDRVFRYSAGAEQLANCKDSMHAMQQQHGHFKCTSCAKVFCLDGAIAPFTNGSSGKRRSSLHKELQNVLQKTLGNGFQSHNIELTIKGWCADCAH